MIGKGKSISHAANAIDYAMKKENAIEIDRNMVVGETGKEISNEFKIFQELNSRCEKNSFSFVVSPSIEDGKELTNSDYKNITQDFLKELNLDNNQYISFLHRDRDHFHLHIFTNRVDELGKAKKDNYIGKKAQKAAEKIAKDRHLVVAKEIQIEKEAKLRNVIEKAHSKVLKNKPKNIQEYVDLMKQHGIKTHLKHANNGKLVGIKFQIGELTIKGSAVNKLMSAMNLQKTILNLTKTIIKGIGRSI